MSLELNINNDLKEAMKAKDEGRLRTVRAIKAAIMLIKTDGTGKELDADGEIKLLQKMVKQRRDSLAFFDQQGRTELAKIEQDEIAIIEQYLPKQLSETEIEDIVRALIQETGANSMKDMGKLMGAANKTLAGKAEGAVISRIVKNLLGV
jgi:uncharacterized protein